VTYLASCTVVTSLSDNDTASIASDLGASVHRTDAFYEPRGAATFNKARAMNEAIPREGWVLFFDADILPPVGWLDVVTRSGPTCGNLYGAARRQGESAADESKDDLPMIPDRELAGFFQMWHRDDPIASARGGKILNEWTHAGGYDSDFAFLWPQMRRIILPITTLHIGEPGRNWCGRGNDVAMAALRAKRRQMNGHRHERL
jgi:hypothetical protein